MTTYASYYDASNTQDKPTKPLVVVGLLSTTKKWSKCEVEWNQVLDDFKVPYLHMREFAHSIGPYSNWKGDLTKRADFLGQLISILKRSVNIAFQYRLVPELFQKLDKEYQLTEAWGNPYAFTASITVRMAHEWFEAHHPKDQMEHLVEKGDPGQGQLLPHFEGLPFKPVLKATIDPATGRHLAPFQAVDLLAYEARLNIERHLDGKKQVIRRSLAQLRKIPYRAYLCDEEVLRNVIADNSDTCPPRAK